MTDTIASLERDFDDATAEDLPELLEAHGVTPELIRGGLLVREKLGRINDVIHAAGIALALPYLLEPGERLQRPSLGAGNDASRIYDVETDRRIAEFKFARWRGSDARRQRELFKDLLHLAADPSGRMPELYVLGPQPIRFLRHTKSTAGWALNGAKDTTKELFEREFASLGTPIAHFTSGPAKRVALVDLEQRLPDLFNTQASGNGAPV